MAKPIKPVPPFSSAKLRFQGHGLGDTVQLGIVVRHLKKAYPHAELLVESHAGTQAIFSPMCKAEPIAWPWRYEGYEAGVYCHWEQVEKSYYKLPATKVTRCLTELFQVEPDLNLYYYSCEITEADRQRVDDYLAKLPLEHYKGFVLLHYRGTSGPQRKNLDVVEAELAAGSFLAQGYLVILLEWSQRPDPLLNGKTIVGAHELWSCTEANQLYAEVGVLAALIERAEAFVGIDSGPEHVAACTDTPTFVIWGDNHPAHCFDFTDNLLHFVPPWHADNMRPASRDLGLQVFNSCYDYSVIERTSEFFDSLAWYCQLELDRWEERRAARPYL